MCNATLSIEVLKLHLAALEAIRGTVLGHAVTIGHGQIRRLQVDSQMDLLVQYAALLQAAYRQELEAHADWYRSAPRPVLPVVDIAAMTVRHETCTGNTRFQLSMCRGLEVFREEEDSDKGKALKLCDLADVGRPGTISSRLSSQEIGDLISWLYNQGVGATEENDWTTTKPTFMVEQAQFLADLLLATYDPSGISFELPPL